MNTKRFRSKFLQLAVAVFFALKFTPSNGLALDLSGPLVEADWLERNVNEVVLLDVRKRPDSFFYDGHIAGARLVPTKRIRSSRVEGGVTIDKMLPEKKAFESLMRDLGVADDSAVVITMQGEYPDQIARAARLYWQLKFFGHDNVALLNGGNAAWRGDLFTDHGDDKATPKGTYAVRGENRSILAETPDVEIAVRGGETQLIDTRPFKTFVGLRGKSYVYARGHIPGAKNLPAEYLLDMTAGSSPIRFVDTMAAREIIGGMNIALDDPTIVYCNSGMLAATTWFMLSEVLGMKSAKLYDGSMHEWTKRNRDLVTKYLN